LIITEAGGLVGNFTGEPDFLYQREILAGTPRIYGQLVKTLAPYSRVIADQELALAAAEQEDESDAEDDELISSLQAAEDAAQSEKSALAEPVKRTRITAAAKAEEVRQEGESGNASNRGDAPF
jgi:myo-inositol-1(or 4)-monophosphatase